MWDRLLGLRLASSTTAAEADQVAQRMDDVTASQLDRAGRAMVVIGAFILDAAITALALVLAWYISYFADGSVDRGLAAMLDVWFVWVAAVVLIVSVVAALARVMRGGSIALLLGGIGGFGVMLAGLRVVAGTSPHEFWLLVFAAAAIGGLALSGGASVRLLARLSTPGPRA